MKKKPFILFVVLFMIGCQSSPSVGLATETPFPSITPVPSETLVPSQTSSPLPTLTASATVRPTFTPSATGTPQPPLMVREWYPDNVLVYFGSEPGIGITFPQSPDLILYADGRIFITNELDVNDGYSTFRKQVAFKRLPQKDICRILNTLDQIGYLDYDPEDYYSESRAHSVDDAGSNIINVNAWRINKGTYYALGTHLYFEKFENNWEPWVPPALRNTYHFLANFPHADFEIYNPEELLIWVYSLPDLHDESLKSLSKGWPLQSPSVGELYKQTGSNENHPGDDYAILSGRDAQVIFDYFGGTYDWRGELVLENGIAYVVFVRPLLPYEKIHLYVSEFPAPNSPRPNFKLTCYPPDGTLPIPTP